MSVHFVPGAPRASPAIVSDLAVRLGDHLRQASGCRKEGDEAGLQGMIDVAFAGEQGVRRQEVFRQFLMPAAILVIDEGALDQVPDLAVVFLVKFAGEMLVQPTLPAMRRMMRSAMLSALLR